MSGSLEELIKQQRPALSTHYKLANLVLESTDVGSPTTNCPFSSSQACFVLCFPLFQRSSYMQSFSLSTFLNSAHPSRSSSNSILFCDVSPGNLSLLQFLNIPLLHGPCFPPTTEQTLFEKPFGLFAYKAKRAVRWHEGKSEPQGKRPKQHTSPDFTVYANLVTFFYHSPAWKGKAMNCEVNSICIG